MLSTFMLVSAETVHGIEGTLLQVEEMPASVRLTLGDVKISEESCLHQKPVKIIRLTLKSKLAKSETKLWPGQQVRLDAVLLPPNEPIAPGAYDFRRKAYFSGISAVGFAISRPQILKEAPSSFITKLTSFRHSITTLLRESIGGVEGEIAVGLVTGDRAGIPENIRQAFANSGLAHILAISGLHLSIVAGLAFLCIRPGLAFLCIRRGLSLFPSIVLRWPVKKWAAGAALFFTFAYLLVSGMSIPAQRAFIMTGIVLLGVLTDRTALTLRNVALAASLILLIAPESLMLPSFQMSFSAVIALVSGYEALRQPLSEWSVKKEGSRRFFLYLSGILISTILATAATTPYVIYTFNRFTLHAIPANLVSIPLLAFAIMPLLVIFLCLSSFGLEGWVVYPLKLSIGWMTAIGIEIGSWPGSVLLVHAMSPLGLGLFTLGALWLALWKTSWRWAGWIGIVSCIGIMWVNRPPDLYVLAEKKLISFAGESQKVWVNSLRSGRFARESWMKIAAAKECDKFDKMLKNKKQNLLSSTDKGYFLQTSSGNIFLEEEKESFCQDWSCRLIHQESRETLEFEQLVEKGGHLVWITPQGFILQTVVDWSGNRPWCLRWTP